MLRLVARICQILAATLKFSFGNFYPACRKHLTNSCRKPEENLVWKSEKAYFFTCKSHFFRLAPSFIQDCEKNSLNACGKQEKSCHKIISELSQKFDTFLLQASTFFSILEFFYECVLPATNICQQFFSFNFAGRQIIIYHTYAVNFKKF